MVSTTEKELRQIREEYGRRRNVFSSLKTTTDAVEETVKELLLEHEAKAEIVSAAIAQNENRRTAIHPS